MQLPVLSWATWVFDQVLHLCLFLHNSWLSRTVTAARPYIFFMWSCWSVSRCYFRSYFIVIGATGATADFKRHMSASSSSLAKTSTAKNTRIPICVSSNASLRRSSEGSNSGARGMGQLSCLLQSCHRHRRHVMCVPHHLTAPSSSL